MSFHPEKSKIFFFIAILIMLLGFAIEIIGVNTGYPFGEYRYGDPLGPQLLGTPFMIGVNWFIMSYCGAMLFRNTTKSKFLNAFFAGIAITLFDFIMEPVAIHLDFWTWNEVQVPLQNYITWGICITIFSLLIYRIDSGKENRISNWVLGCQVFFFSAILLGISL
jgi:putative membrane protein